MLLSIEIEIYSLDKAFIQLLMKEIKHILFEKLEGINSSFDIYSSFEGEMKGMNWSQQF